MTVETPPSDAVPIERELPKEDMQVIVWASDPSVAIHHFPTTAYRRGDEWWAGFPGHWLRLSSYGWAVTHWRAI